MPVVIQLMLVYLARRRARNQKYGAAYVSCRECYHCRSKFISHGSGEEARKKNGNSNISINHLPREEVLLRNEKLFLILVRIHRGNARTGTELANELSRHSKRRRFYGNNFSKCIHVEASRKISSQLGAQTTAIDFLEWHIIRFYLFRHLGKHTFWLNLP